MTVITAQMMNTDFVSRCIAMKALSKSGGGSTGHKPEDYQSGGKYYGLAGNAIWLIRGKSIIEFGDPIYLLNGTSIIHLGNVEEVVENV